MRNIEMVNRQQRAFSQQLRFNCVRKTLSMPKTKLGSPFVCMFVKLLLLPLSLLPFESANAIQPKIHTCMPVCLKRLNGYAYTFPCLCSFTFVRYSFWLDVFFSLLLILPYSCIIESCTHIIFGFAIEWWHSAKFVNEMEWICNVYMFPVGRLLDIHICYIICYKCIVVLLLLDLYVLPRNFAFFKEAVPQGKMWSRICYWFVRFHFSFIALPFVVLCFLYTLYRFSIVKWNWKNVLLCSLAFAANALAQQQQQQKVMQ